MNKTLKKFPQCTVHNSPFRYNPKEIYRKQILKTGIADPEKRENSASQLRHTGSDSTIFKLRAASAAVTSGKMRPKAHPCGRFKKIGKIPAHRKCLFVCLFQHLLPVQNFGDVCALWVFKSRNWSQREKGLQLRSVEGSSVGQIVDGKPRVWCALGLWAVKLRGKVSTSCCFEVLWCV